MSQQQGSSCPKAPKLLEVANKNVLKDNEEAGVGELMEELPETSFGRSKFKRGKKDEEDLDQPITIQFCTLSPVMANNYLLANEFKSKEDVKEEMEDNEEEACVLEFEEGQTSQEVYDEEEDDGMTDIEEVIDLEAERKRIEVSRNTLLKQLQQEGVREVDLLGEPFGRSFDYYVLYGTPKRKKRVPPSEKYGSPPRILPPTGWITKEEALKESTEEIQEAEIQCKILHVDLSQRDNSTEDKQEVKIDAAGKVIFKIPTMKLTKHMRPLYVKALVNGIPVAKLIIDNGATINTIPSRMMRKFAETESDMILTEVILTSFNGEATSAKEVMPLDITVGTTTRTTVFFVIHGPTSYNMLLGRNRIHGSRCIPSSLHQCLVFWNDKGQAEVMQADHKPFIAEANSVERFMYEGNY
ncbi:unnamed protein product [Fraxinus pennsylvanica]|uniref:Aspartic peptidase DDI1-type domain-containing protein n=1 Tax=Fraxinus pennsylvanica TaxID=56036 RepID=A0AAD2E5W7_9LAMI|nr:unnamed protein product [Fraxinus pennsylvanica]